MRNEREREKFHIGRMQNNREKMLYLYNVFEGKKKKTTLKAIVAPNLTIVPISDLRINHFEERRNYTIHTRVGQLDSVFGLMFSNMRFYANKHYF